eukprot:scaffold151529_cov31-Prasinocladus_malaysianus.AAC.2
MRGLSTISSLPANKASCRQAWQKATNFLCASAHRCSLRSSRSWRCFGAVSGRCCVSRTNTSPTRPTTAASARCL